MRAEHQPPHLPGNVVGAVSSSADGSMRDPTGNPQSAKAMEAWLMKVGIEPRQTVGLRIKYGEDRTYDVITEVDHVPGEGIFTPEGWIDADALVTKEPGVALLLLTGDCNSIMIADPESGAIALVHAGWHSTIVDLLLKVVQHLEEEHGANPADLIVYFPPSIRRDSYGLDYLANIGTLDHSGKPRWHSPAYTTQREDGKYGVDLVSYNLELLHAAGVPPENIEVADADTFTHPDYFSNHRRHYESEGPRNLGRIATVIMRKR